LSRALIENRKIGGLTPLIVPSGSTDVRWLVSDQLGTPRMIFDQSGSLANVSRHDYLPFGEELSGGSRAAALGYTNSDGTRQQFTQKERDIETGLDYFGARYFASMQGRFTSADPLLGSARIENPQSWNRYSYVLGNPLKFSDPLGLFEYLDGTSDNDKKRINTAYEGLVKSRDKYKAGSDQYKAIEKSLKALGAPGEKNNVFVGVDNATSQTGTSRLGSGLRFVRS